MIKELFLFHTIGLGLGIILDQIIGDPHCLPHPIRAIGSLILFLEKKLLGEEPAKEKRDPFKEKKSGIVMWILVVGVTAFVTTFVLQFRKYTRDNLRGSADLLHPCRKKPLQGEHGGFLLP